MNFLWSLNTTIVGVYWYLTQAILNNQEYRYYAFGMYDLMTTPPTYSYVCTTGSFVRYDSSTPGGRYNFSNKFYILELQVNKNIFIWNQNLFFYLI